MCEHPFGTMNRGFNQGYLLLKGTAKVSREMGFTMLATTYEGLLIISE